MIVTVVIFICDRSRLHYCVYLYAIALLLRETQT